MVDFREGRGGKKPPPAHPGAAPKKPNLNRVKDELPLTRFERFLALKELHVELGNA